MAEDLNISKKQKNRYTRHNRYFISNLKTNFAHTLVEKIRADPYQNPENPHLIIGTVPKDDQNTKYDVPKGVTKVIDQDKVNLMQKLLLDSDIIIYDLNSCDLEEAEFAIKTLKMGDFNENKYFICISSLMVWSQTKPKEKKEGDEDDEQPEEPEEGEEEEPKEEEQQPQDGDEEVVKKVYVRFQEKDFPLRKPLPKYEILKQLETLCLSSSYSKPNFFSFVLCSGIQYGNGEDFFYEHFKQAWLQDPTELEYYGNGKNRIPMIHVKDLAEYAFKIPDRPPQNKYIFAIDHNKRPVQQSVIRAISKGMGTGKVVSRSVPENYLELDDANLDIFMLDLKMKPSQIFEQGDEEPEEEAQEEDDPNNNKIKLPKFKFNWWCKEGIQKNIKKISQEFNSYQSLKPNRILVAGPPASGKTYFSQMLAKYYNVPYINIKSVIKEVESLNNEFGEEVRNALQEAKDKLIEQEQEKLDKLKELKKASEDAEVDQSKIFPRLPDELVYKAVQMRLNQNDCINRGYVLDGYPRNYQNARGCFLIKEQPQEGQDVDEESLPLVVNKNIVPQSVIKLEASDQFLFDRVKNLPEELIEGSHYDEKDMKRRLKLYREYNITENGQDIVDDFFASNQIELLNLNIEAKQTDYFNIMISYINRNGQFNNYQKFLQENEKNRFEEELKKQQNVNMIQEQNEQNRNKIENQLRDLMQEQHKLKIEDQKKADLSLLDQRSKPLRDYLNLNLEPFLQEGLVQILKEKPEDPVDFLAEYLFKRSLEVKFPDPKQFSNFQQKKNEMLL